MAAPTISPYSFPPVRLAEFIAGIAAACLMRDHGWRLRGLVLPLSATLGGYVAASLLANTPFGAASATGIGFVLLFCTGHRTARARSPHPPPVSFLAAGTPSGLVAPPSRRHTSSLWNERPSAATRGDAVIVNVSPSTAR